MAIKDWKKTKSKAYSTLFIRKNTYGNSLKEIGIGQEIMSGKWEVDFFNITGKKYKIFKTKSKALAYAKSYMKKH